MCKMLLFWAKIGKASANFIRLDKKTEEIPFWVRFGFGYHLNA